METFRHKAKSSGLYFLSNSIVTFAEGPNRSQKTASCDLCVNVVRIIPFCSIFQDNSPQIFLFYYLCLSFFLFEIMQIQEILDHRIMVLDGAMGTMIQQYGLSESDFRGERFADITALQKGNNDLLCLTRPQIISAIHEAYLDAGADIIETNTFNANRISMSDYDMQSVVAEINFEAARLARNVADNYSAKTPDKPRFVAGSVGPTNKTCSMSPDVNDPALRTLTFDDLTDAYREQIAALIDGGVDLLLFETIFDTLNAKAALYAAEEVMQEKGKHLPIMLSVTLSDKGGRTLSGQTLDAFLSSVRHARLLSVGLNCSFGARDMKPFLKQLSETAPYYISAYPNAGLPNRFGQYDETPETMALQIKEFIDEQLVNIVGGCCGTTPEHIAAIARLAAGKQPRRPHVQRPMLSLSGLEVLNVVPENNFIHVGERCNVAGSRKFLRLISEKNYDEALEIARKQVADGAQIIDINMDDAMLDAHDEMVTFLNRIASEPDICRVPVMIDSSKWPVILAGLKCVQGKCIVNSISLKEGEATFLAHAREIHRLGAAMVVMAFDETGQADSYARKIAVCQRAYTLLTREGIDPNDIIFDPNVLALATGIDEHLNYGADFIAAVKWIKENLPGAKVSGGISNLSFSFRGNNYIREAMHAVFLFHAIQAGMDMAIVNPATSVTYTDIPEELLCRIEDVIFNRRPDATERLIEAAESHKGQTTQQQPQTGQGDPRDLMSLDERLEYALVKGVSDRLDADLHEALAVYGSAVKIIEGPLMNGMNRVGQLFGEGKMFLPQVVKTARTMKQAVAILQPYIPVQKESGRKNGKFLLATVKGDVHDIGKNIVAVVLGCNNYDIIDLGVMVPTEIIIETALREKVDIIGVSGLITPSLEEMCHIAEAMEKAGLKIPLMVGGATTSKLHTAVKIAPRYSGPVIHTRDAAQIPVVAAQWLNEQTRESFLRELHREQEELRRSVETRQEPLLSYAEANAQAFTADWTHYTPTVPQMPGERRELKLSIQEVRPCINWKYFLHTWRLTGNASPLDGCCQHCMTQLPHITPEEPDKAQETERLLDDAASWLDQLEKEDDTMFLQARFGIFAAHSNGNRIVLHTAEGDVVIPCLRQQKTKPEGAYLALPDFVMPQNQENRTDYVGAFVVTISQGLAAKIEQLKQGDDHYAALLLQSLCDRLAEAATEWLHYRIRTRYWGYMPMEKPHVPSLLSQHYQGIRPAVGYPSLPDQSLGFTLDTLLDFAKAGVTVTENGALYPSSTVTGLLIAHPQASYFHIGVIDNEQRKIYCRERGYSLEESYKWLSLS